MISIHLHDDRITTIINVPTYILYNIYTSYRLLQQGSFTNFIKLLNYIVSAIAYNIIMCYKLGTIMYTV